MKTIDDSFVLFMAVFIRDRWHVTTFETDAYYNMVRHSYPVMVFNEMQDLKATGVPYTLD